ncbi:MAG: VWA domain-containing protein, partial [Aequorivita vladivostokensis]|nr:VWA domain-containing protein [Aequorivita vladivostokensis]
MKKTWVYFIVLLSLTVVLSNGIAAEDIKVIVRNAGATLNYQILDDGKLLVSVLDEKDEPIRGLKVEDFIVGSGIRKAEVLSATPSETTEAVPLNVVLVVDNSFSMRERRAVKPLLTAMDEFFKTVRPIDNIHLVVFDNRPALKVGSRSLHSKTFNSSDINRLRNFLKESLEQNSTGKTYLYEAMAAGVDIIRGMPAKEQKFM